MIGIKVSFTAFEYFISQCRDVCVCVMFCNIAKRDSEIYLKGKGARHCKGAATTNS